MDIELATGADTEAPAEVVAPAPVGEKGETTVEPESKGDAEGGAVPLTLEEFMGENELMRSAYDLRAEELREEGRRKAQSEFDTSIRPIINKVNANSEDYSKTATSALNEIMRLNTTLDGLRESGEMDVPNLQRALFSVPGAWTALERFNGWREKSGMYDGFRMVAAKLAQDIPGEAGAKFTGEYAQRWTNAQNDADDMNSVFTDMMKARDAAMIEKATTPLQRRIKALEAANAGKEIEIREGKGPSTAAGKTAVQKAYKDMTYEERVALTPQEREAATREALR